MLKHYWREYSFLGVDVLSDDDQKIKTILANQLSLVVCLMSPMLVALFFAYDYSLGVSLSLLLPILLSLFVLWLNKRGFKRYAGVVLSLIIPVTLVLSQLLLRIQTPLQVLKEGDYYRSSLWLMAAIMIPILVIDSKKRTLQYALVGLIFLLIFSLNPIYQLIGAGIKDVGFDQSDFKLYNIISALVGVLVASGLMFMNRLNLYYRDKMSQMRDNMIESEKMASLGVLTAGLGHEINNPLNFIRGGGQIVLKELENETTDSEVIKDSVKLIDQGVDRIATIVDSLQHFSRDHNIDEECCEISKILKTSISLISTGSQGCFEVISDFGTSELIVKGDSNQLYHAFLSILKNAVQAISDHGKIRVRAVQQDQLCHILIKDDGIGIKKQDLSRVMEPFFTTREPGQGIGMGLSIAYNIIKRHHGNLTVTSMQSEGTTVEITLPAVTKK